MFVHILWHGGTVHNVPFVRGINTHACFDKEKHLFLTPHERVYNELKEFDNVRMVENTGLLNQAYMLGKWIIVHALDAPIREFLQTDKKILQRTIVRTWGHDLNDRFHYDTRKTMKALLLKQLYRYKLRQLHMFTGENEIDKTNIETCVGKMPFQRLHYFGKTDAELALLEGHIKEKSENESKKIMVGHSGFPVERHIEILTMLKKYTEENITVVLPLSYGAPEYILKVKEHATRIFGEKALFMENFMPYPEYIKFLSGMDLVILPQIGSSALGNFNLLAKLKIPLVLDKRGITNQALLKDGIMVSSFEDIANTSLSAVISKSTKDIEKIQKIYGYSLTNEEVYRLQQAFFEKLENAS